MASLSTTIREQLVGLAGKDSSEHLAIDIYRIVQVQAELLYHTERIRQHLAEDPFRALQGLNTQDIGEKLRVVDYECVRTRQDYVRIEAHVDIDGDAKKRPGNPRLVFVFERETPSQGPATMLTYSIEFAPDASRANCKILWVQVVATGSYPSKKPAINMSEREDDEWSDVTRDDGGQFAVHEQGDGADEEHGHVAGEEQGGGGQDIGNRRKRIKRSDGLLDETSCHDQTATDDRQDLDRDEEHDRFVAHMDADILAEFISLVGEMDEATAFFLLMSFPFYETEWDLVGFVLDAVFGSQSDEEEEEEATP